MRTSFGERKPHPKRRNSRKISEKYGQKNQDGRLSITQVSLRRRNYWVECFINISKPCALEKYYSFKISKMLVVVKRATECFTRSVNVLSTQPHILLSLYTWKPARHQILNNWKILEESYHRTYHGKKNSLKLKHDHKSQYTYELLIIYI